MENTDAATSPTTSSAQAIQVPSVRWAGSMSFDFGTKRLQYRAFQLKADAGAIVLGDAVVLRTGRGSSLGVALVEQCWQSTASNVKYGTFSILPAIPGTCGRAVVHSPVPDVVELPLSEVVSKARVEAMPLAPAANDDDVDDLAATGAGVSASAAACLHCRLTNAPQRQTILFVSFSEIDRALADLQKQLDAEDKRLATKSARGGAGSASHSGNKKAPPGGTPVTESVSVASTSLEERIVSVARLHKRAVKACTTWCARCSLFTLGSGCEVAPALADPAAAMALLSSGETGLDSLLKVSERVSQRVVDVAEELGSAFRLVGRKTSRAEAAPSADNATTSSPIDSGSEPPVKRHTTELAQSDTQPKPPPAPERLERVRQRALEAAEYIEQVASQHASRTNSPVNDSGEEARKAAVSPAVRSRVTFAVPDVLPVEGSSVKEEPDQAQAGTAVHNTVAATSQRVSSDAVFQAATWAAAGLDLNLLRATQAEFGPIRRT
jgi:hypothetical protein